MSILEPSLFQPSTQKRIFWLLGLAIGINLLYPGEVFAQSTLFFILLVNLLFVLTIIASMGSPTKASLHFDWPLFLILTMAAIPGTVYSINPKRSLETICLFLAYFGLYYLILHLQIESKNLLNALFILSLLESLICFYAIYQYFFEFNQLKNEITNFHAMDPAFREALLARAESHRVFAHFILPNSLAGFITMVLPLHFYFLFFSLESCRPSESLLIPSRISGVLSFPQLNLWLRMIAMTGILLSLITLALTKSFGGWLCLFSSGTVIFLGIFRKRIRWGKKLWITVFFFLSAAVGWLFGVGQARSFYLWDIARPGNPISPRLNNFLTSLKILRDFPWTGVGLNNYGTINPRYQSDSSYITQFAHNTPLQLLAECGLPLLIAGIIVWIYFGSRNSSNSPQAVTCGFSGAFRVCLQASLLAWIVHNLIDINWYFPSLGGLGLLIYSIYKKSGLSINPIDETKLSPQRASTPGNSFRTLFQGGLVALIFLLANGFFLCSYFSDRLLEMTVGAMKNAEYQAAWSYAKWARRLCPLNPEAEILSARAYAVEHQEGNDRSTLLLSLKEALQRAIHLDPYNARYHYELSKILNGLNEKEASEKEQATAVSLSPSETQYRKTR
jgi:hypothetical protein